MFGTYRQDQHCSSHQLAGYGTTGFGWILWGLGKIFATPRPMRIGLSGLLLWIGMVGVSLATPAPNGTQASDAQGTASTQPAGTIKDPFNPHGYMLEMAAKMQSSRPRDAVTSETGIQRSLRPTAKATSAAPKPDQGAWPPEDHPAALAPTTTKPVSSGARWLGSGDPLVQTKTPSSSSMGLPLWSPAKDRTAAINKKPESSNSHIRWLTPDGSIPAKSPTADAATNQMGWRPSSKQATATPLGSASPMRQANWLTPTPAATPQPTVTKPATNQMGWQPSNRQLAPAPVRHASPIRHARWLTPTPEATPQAPVMEPTINQMNSHPMGNQTAATPAITPAATPPTAWPSTTTPTATNQTTWQPVAQPTLSQPTMPEQPTRQTTWLASPTQAAPQPVATQPVVSQTTPPTANYQAAQQPAQPSQPVNQKTWLAPENRAAQRALNKIRMRESGVSETSVATSTAVRTNEMPLPSVATATPQLDPKQLNIQNTKPSPQMLLLSGGTVNPQMAYMAINPAAYAATDLSQAKHFYEEEKTPWSLGADLDKYREHALTEGSRDFGVSLTKALERIGLAVEDTTNVITLGYASDRGQPFRTNDGKGLFEDPGRVPQQAGATIGSLGNGLYSMADLVTLNALPDPDKSVYRDNHPIVRPLIFTGRTIGGAWKTTEEIGNAVTWGYFDNVTGSIGMCIEDLIEILKHAGQAVTNLARVPVHLIGGKDKGADKALDWVLLVPLEFASNVVEMKGISNMDDYETAFADKGVIGSILELGGSTFIVYRALDELADELKDDDHHSHRQTTEEPVEPEPTPEPSVVVPDTPSTGIWTDYLFGSDGVISAPRIIE